MLSTQREAPLSDEAVAVLMARSHLKGPDDRTSTSLLNTARRTDGV